MPHNTAIAEELLFLLEIIDLKKRFYSFEELSKLFLIEQIKKNKFSDFHRMPHKKLTENHSVFIQILKIIRSFIIKNL